MWQLDNHLTLDLTAGKDSQDVKSLNGRGLQLALKQSGKADHRTSMEAIRSFPPRYCFLISDKNKKKGKMSCILHAASLHTGMQIIAKHTLWLNDQCILSD